MSYFRKFESPTYLICMGTIFIVIGLSFLIRAPSGLVYFVTIFGFSELAFGIILIYLRKRKKLRAPAKATKYVPRSPLYDQQFQDTFPYICDKCKGFLDRQLDYCEKCGEKDSVRKATRLDYIRSD